MTYRSPALLHARPLEYRRDGRVVASRKLLEGVQGWQPLAVFDTGDGRVVDVHEVCGSSEADVHLAPDLGQDRADTVLYWFHVVKIATPCRFVKQEIRQVL